MQKTKWYSMKNDTGEIFIYEEIGGGFIGGVGANEFIKDMKALGDSDTITVRINSSGGSVFDGFAIYNALRQSKKHIITKVDGVAASIASVIALAGNERYIAENGYFMMHNPWTMTVGNADEHRKSIEVLDKLTATMVNIYKRNSVLSEEDIASKMQRETWLNASEAHQIGFFTDIQEEFKVAAHLDLSKFKNVPQTLIPKNSLWKQKLQMRRLKLSA